MWRGLIAGVGLMIAGIVLLDGMGATAKLLGSDYPAQQISLARNLFGLLPTFAILLVAGGGRIRLAQLRLRQWRLGLARGLMVAVAQLALYHSFTRLELASAATIGYSGPFFITALAIPWLGERVGPWRWLAILIGFAGVILVIRPGSAIFTWHALLPALAAFCYANSLVVTRLFDSSASHAAINLYAQIGAIVASSLLLATTSAPVLPPPSALWHDLALFVLLGGLGGFGVFLLTLAYRRTEASVLAPFEYLGLCSALAIGWLVFGEWPWERIFPGILLIVAAGLVMVWREHRSGE